MSDQIEVWPEFVRNANLKRAYGWLALGILLSAVCLHVVYLQARFGMLKALDPHLLRAWHRGTGEVLYLFLLGLSRIVTVVVLWPLLGFASYILWHKRRVYDAFGLLCAITLPAVIALAAKLIYNVPRPRVEWNYGAHWSHAFPSGHVALTMTLGGMTAYIGWREGKSKTWTGVAIAVTIAATMMMGFGRVALGAHFFSDVVGGFALGIIWLPVSIAITRALGARSRAGKE